MTDAFEDLVKLHIQNGSPLPKRLLEGINIGDIDDLFEEVTAKPSREIYTLYRLFNGTDASGTPSLGELCLGPAWIFPDLAQACQIHFTGVMSGYWEEHLFPVFTSGMDDYLLLDTQKDNAPLLAHIEDVPELIPAYINLERFFQTSAACMKEGVFFIDEEGLLDMDVDKEFLLSARMNPGMAYWTD